ncbi:MAG: DoxX family protein [Rikenellaceae bacterium]|nr:DoxX family protein [Rikenellaceae bacterium]
MKQTNINNQKYSRTSDLAILFLRLFIGATILLHIIGKLQTYDNAILSYPRILGFNAATSFAIATIAEGMFAAMIILGVATRLAAIAMCIISLMLLLFGILQEATQIDTKLYFIYIGIYATLIISGGGYYAFKVPDSNKKCPD